jgi:predicted phosphodiesterase
MDEPQAKITARVLIISDTHGFVPEAEGDNVRGFHWPLPEADVLIHCGDLVQSGNDSEQQYKDTFDMIEKINAKLKIVIPGNHDTSLDQVVHNKETGRIETGANGKTRGKKPLAGQEKALKIVNDAVNRGRDSVQIRYLHREDAYSFVLENGAGLKIFATPNTPVPPYRTNRKYTPFQFHGTHDFRIPAGTDIVVSHGPSRGILDAKSCGCEDLLAGIAEARPLLHCFGHIHEAWGADMVHWTDEEAPVAPSKGSTYLATQRANRISKAKRFTKTGLASLVKAKKWSNQKRARIVEQMACFVKLQDAAVPEAAVAGFDHVKNLTLGQNTLCVSAPIVDTQQKSSQLPWLIELELPQATEEDKTRAQETLGKILTPSSEYGEVAGVGSSASTKGKKASASGNQNSGPERDSEEEKDPIRGQQAKSPAGKGNKKDVSQAGRRVLRTRKPRPGRGTRKQEILDDDSDELTKAPAGKSRRKRNINSEDDGNDGKSKRKTREVRERKDDSADQAEPKMRYQFRRRGR